MLVGADGSRSAVRQALFGALEVQYTGYIAWRRLVPMELVPKEYLEPPWACSSVRASGEPLSGAQRRMVEFRRFAERREWTAEGWSIRSTVRELLDEFEGLDALGCATSWTRAAAAAVQVGPVRSRPARRLVEGPRDLCSAMRRIRCCRSSATARCSRSGTAWCWAARSRASASIDEALHRYEAAQRERASFVVHESRKAVKQFHAADTESHGQRWRQWAADGASALFTYNPVTQAI